MNESPVVDNGPLWKADYKKLSGSDVEKPCLFGPNGDIYFIELRDASYAATECNEAYSEGRASLLPLVRELIKRLEMYSAEACSMCESENGKCSEECQGMEAERELLDKAKKEVGCE